MLTYIDIINAFTFKLSKAFSDVDIFTDDTTNNFDSECFYVQLIPLPTSVANKVTDEKGFIASIKYYQEPNSSRLNLYDITSELEKTFVRNIQVKDRYLNISNVEPNILQDEIGYYLDFLVTVKYFEDVYVQKIDYELMKDVQINQEIRGD